MSDVVIPGAEGLHPPLGAYTHALLVPAGANVLYISGQVGIRPDGVTPPTLEEQTDQVFQNIEAILSANGYSFTDVIKITTFVVAGNSIAKVRDIRAKYLGDFRPCSTAVFVSALAGPEWQIEIEAIAAKS